MEERQAWASPLRPWPPDAEPTTCPMAGAAQARWAPRPLFVVTRRPPDEIPLANPPYTFVTDGIPAAVAAARNAAGDQDVVLMGRAWYSSASGPGCSTN
jgi:dihydrofolate reductase